MLTTEEEQYFHSIADEIIQDELYLSQKEFIQHGSVSVYEHEINTARLCYEYVARNHIRCDVKALIRASLLHDFFLYDWHKKDDSRKGLHGYTHPFIAAKNAQDRFHLNAKEISVISTHMWPLTFLHFPKCREAWILTLMDKKETLLEMRAKRKMAQ